VTIILLKEYINIGTMSPTFIAKVFLIVAASFGPVYLFTKLNHLLRPSLKRKLMTKESEQGDLKSLDQHLKTSQDDDSLLQY